MTGYFTNAITLEQIRADRPAMIYWSTHTCWWTHDHRHLCKVPRGQPGSGIPCDPRGAPLMQTDNVEDFLEAAERNPGHYGKHGLRAFIASHHLNCVVSGTDRRSTCFSSWGDYNRILDEYDA